MKDGVTTGPGPGIPKHVPAPENLMDAMRRDLAAWALARAAIAKARLG